MSDLTIDYNAFPVYLEYGTSEPIYPLVISVPHAGRFFPPEFLAYTGLTPDQLRQNEDLFVDDLLAPLANEGFTMISMNIGRAFIDVNRDQIELDPKMFADFPSDNLTIENSRCRFGLGLIHRSIGDGTPIYDKPLSYTEIQTRIHNVYEVYHKRLQQLIAKCTRKFGFCVVLDCHSMPSKICRIVPDCGAMDFCIGDLFAQSCPPALSAFLHKTLTDHKYVVTDNIPYSGAFITFNYCQPRKKNYTIQLEINRKIYADEKTLTKNKHFQKTSDNVCDSIRTFSHFLLDF